jgi:hypothetical protein
LAIAFGSITRCNSFGDEPAPAKPLDQDKRRTR